MNKLITAITLTTILGLTQACSSLTVAETSDAETTHQQDKQHNHPKEMQHGEHKSTSKKTLEILTLTQSKLIAPLNILPNTTVPLAITVQDLDGKAVENFDTFQEKLMHLIVVSDDLHFFNHLHPNYQNNGQFKVNANFPHAGGYTLFSSYKPAQSEEQVSTLKTQIAGPTPTSPAPDFTTTKTFETTKINLSVSQPVIKAGEEVRLKFDLKDAVTNQPPTDLQPYLGEKGHLVILRHSKLLTAADYIHAHALSNTAIGKIAFMARFPRAGHYKLWGQFNRNGKVITADFWINVVD